MSSKELMKLLVSKGWELDRVKGSHHTFVKEGRDDIITVPHPEKDLAKGTLQKILKQLKQ
ncbi:type II toxin-antitoxin system HicA family toxin [Serratia sp. BNK-4]|uniref:type II toxin-antitoxin system HicA family toxin n=1 Tax=Serratia sp. BNK-4 TaxID=3376141 RepID=UPI003B43ADFB